MTNKDDFSDSWRVGVVKIGGAEIPFIGKQRQGSVTKGILGLNNSEAIVGKRTTVYGPSNSGDTPIVPEPAVLDKPIDLVDNVS